MTFALSNLATGDKRDAAIEFLNLLMHPTVNGEVCRIINSLSPYSNVTMDNAPDMIMELSTYLNDKARGWNNAPPAMQNKMGECMDIVNASSANKNATLIAHLQYLDDLWKEAV